MVRKKAEPVLAIKSWDEADETLRESGELEISKKVKEGRAQYDINEVREWLKRECAPLDQQIAELALALEAFADEECKSSPFKTKVLTFGSLFFRKSTALKTLPKTTWDQVVALLSERGLEKFIEVKRSAKREEIKGAGLPDTELKALGLRIVVEEPFKYEINEEKFERPDLTDNAAARTAASA